MPTPENGGVMGWWGSPFLEALKKRAEVALNYEVNGVVVMGCWLQQMILMVLP